MHFTELFFTNNSIFRCVVNVNGTYFTSIFAARKVIDNRIEELETTSKRLEQ